MSKPEEVVKEFPTDPVEIEEYLRKLRERIISEVDDDLP